MIEIIYKGKMIEINKLNKIDRRTREYKDAVQTLNEGSYTYTDETVNTINTATYEYVEEPFVNKSDITTEDYETVLAFDGQVRGDEIDWVFDKYFEYFGMRRKKCLCPGVIKQILAKIRVTYERDNDIKK